MPAILVASKMKSGLPKPKPVHSALPIPQTHSRPSALALPPAPVKTLAPPPGQQVGSRPPRSIAPGPEAGGNPQNRRKDREAESWTRTLNPPHCIAISAGTTLGGFSAKTPLVLTVKPIGSEGRGDEDLGRRGGCFMFRYGEEKCFVENLDRPHFSTHDSRK